MKAADLLREPLLHFLLAGASLFALHGVFGAEVTDADRIVVGPDEIAAIVQRSGAQTGRIPSDAELDALVEGWVREEVLYREALAMGLDEGDPVVRQRMIDKMGFLLEGMDGEDPDAAYQEIRARYEVVGAP